MEVQVDSRSDLPESGNTVGKNHAVGPEEALHPPQIPTIPQNETKVIAQAAPKRRGRKKKSEILAMQAALESEKSAVEPEHQPLPEKISKKGRPCKQINYFELANPDDDFSAKVKKEESEESEGAEYKLNDDEGRRNKVKVKRKKGAGRGRPRKMKDTSVNDLPQSSSDRERTEGTIVRPSASSQDNLDGAGTHFLAQLDTVSSIQREISEISIGENTDCDKNTSDGIPPNSTLTDNEKLLEALSSDKRYNFHGQTVKMMSTLLTFYKGKNSEASTSAASNSEETPISTPVYRKRGRRPNSLKLAEQNLDDIVNDGISNSNTTVTCAICNETLSKQTWAHHKQRYHNNLAWKMGDRPLDLSDESLILRILNDLYKKKKPLYCDKCGDAKKSVVGFLSHQSQCKSAASGQSENAKIACEFCGRKLLPVSLVTHIRMVHAEKKNNSVVAEGQPNEGGSLPDGKRKAAEKAMAVIENAAKNENAYYTSDLNFDSEDFARKVLDEELQTYQVIECIFTDCHFQSEDLEESLKHINECTHKPQTGYVCKECLCVTPVLKDIRKHMEQIHNLQDFDDENFIPPTKSTAPSASSAFYGGNFPDFLAPLKRSNNLEIFGASFKWTHELHEQNFSAELFTNLMPTCADWPVLPRNQVKDYLPKMNESCEVARTCVQSYTTNVFQQDYTFKRYALFEAKQHEDGKCTIFCGGPVTALAWAPTPHRLLKENQVLAVSVLSSPEEVYLVSENYSKPSTIQFWNFGRLSNKDGPPTSEPPKFMFGLAHDHGPVWHMEWCPSSCYNNNNTNVDENPEGTTGKDWSGRVGLLAVTSTESFVYIYSVPMLGVGVHEGVFYKPKPILKLSLTRPNTPHRIQKKYYPCKISWTKAKGHRFIAVGYTHGYVALFDLSKTTPLLRHKDPADGVVCLLPYRAAQVHQQKITALVLHHSNGGNRWLMTASTDRSVSLWDLENFSYPISTSKKNMITDGLWLTHWLCHVIAQDEGTTHLKSRTLFQQARDFNNVGSRSSLSVMFSNSTVNTLSNSDWLSCVMQANNNGEIQALMYDQLISFNTFLRHTKRQRMLLAYIHLLEKGKSPKERLKDFAKKKAIHKAVSKKREKGTVSIDIKDSGRGPGLGVEPALYHTAEKKYALLFCDNKMESMDDFPASTQSQLVAGSDDLLQSDPSLYPLNAINKVAFSPNRQSSLYYAAGYQAGFVRVTWMKFLKDDAQIK